MGTDRGFRGDGTLAQEFIDLPDGTLVSKDYDKTGIRTIEERYYRKDGTLKMRKQYDEKGQWVTIKYDRTGKEIKEQIQLSDEIRELVKSAELLSKKRKKRQITSIQKEGIKWKKI